MRLQEKCLTKTCQRAADVCGLCRKCYLASLRARNKGEVTTEELIELKMLKPKHSKPQSEFHSQLVDLLARKRKSKQCQNESKSA